MNPDRNAVYWSLPLGSWFATRIRVSVFFPLLVLLLAASQRLGSIEVGLTFGLVLFISVLLHEFGHVIAARMTGGDGEEILITPFGGLATCNPAPTFSSRFGSVAGGPLVNLSLCMLTLPAILTTSRETLRDCLNPFVFPSLELTADSVAALVEPLLLIVFTANWLLLLINLLPVHPLDGGRMLYILLQARMESYVARSVYLRTGLICGWVMVLVGLLLENTWLMAIAAVVISLNLSETYQMHFQGETEESFMGYDFSQGYTSLERSLTDDDDEHPSQPGLLARWKAQREEDRQRRQAEEDRHMEQRLDELLDKLHSQGEAALSSAEKKQLKEISARLRERKA
ncbi:MAG: site-2 protease family protein [Planctomycetota bacterium]|jgi:Zn-dependent protease